MPFVQGDGLFTVPEAIVTNVFMQLPVHFHGFSIAVTEIFGAGNKVVMGIITREQTKPPAKPSGLMPPMYGQLKEGKLTHFFQAVDTAAINK